MIVKLDGRTMTRMFHMAATRPAASSFSTFGPRGEHARPDTCVRFAPSSPISVGYLAGNQGLTWDQKSGAAM
jgi:hypothetical protein